MHLTHAGYRKCLLQKGFINNLINTVDIHGADALSTYPSSEPPLESLANFLARYKLFSPESPKEVTHQQPPLNKHNENKTLLVLFIYR